MTTPVGTSVTADCRTGTKRAGVLRRSSSKGLDAQGHNAIGVDRDGGVWRGRIQWDRAGEEFIGRLAPNRLTEALLDAGLPGPSRPTPPRRRKW